MKILIVNDDAGLRDAWGRLLKTNGHEDVRGAIDEAMALASIKDIIRENGRDVKKIEFLIIIDFNLPRNCEGLQLIRTVHRLYPSIRIILTSGDMTDKIATEAIELGAEAAVSNMEFPAYLMDECWNQQMKGGH